MNQQLIYEQLRRLQRNYNKQYGSESLLVLTDGLSLAPDEVMKPAVDALILHFAQLPSPAKILEFIEREWDIIKQKEAVKREIEDAKTRREALELHNVQPASPFGKETVALILELFNGHIDKKRYLIECGKLMDKYNRPADDQEWIQEQWKTLKIAYN